MQPPPPDPGSVATAPPLARVATAIQYESVVETETTGRRPGWIYAVVGVYGLIVIGLSLLPFVLPLLSGEGVWGPLVATATVLVLAEVALLFVPVRVASRRPITRRSLWVPLLGSAVLAALVGLGLSFTLLDYFDGWGWDYGELAVFGTAGLFWLVWTFVFWALSYRTGPEAVATKLHRWLLSGSVLELLVAVPTHVVVRRRGDCCAGVGTGIGICSGIIVMLLAFGPSVAFLYYRRWKQVKLPSPKERG